MQFHLPQPLFQIHAVPGILLNLRLPHLNALAAAAYGPHSSPRVVRVEAAIVDYGDADGLQGCVVEQDPLLAVALNGGVPQRELPAASEEYGWAGDGGKFAPIYLYSAIECQPQAVAAAFAHRRIGDAQGSSPRRSRR